MTTTRKTTLRLAGLAAISVLALGACGSSNDDAAGTSPVTSTAGTSTAATSAESSTTASTPRNSTPVRELVVPAADFPPGFEVQEVPVGEMNRVAEQLLDATQNAKFTPSSCGQLNILPKDFDVSKVGLAVATKGATALSTSVAESDVTIAQQRASVTGKCANVTAEFTQGELAGATVAVKQSLVEAPAVKTKDVLVVDQQSTVSLRGSSSSSELNRLGLAAVNGYLVTVQYRSAGGQPIDDAVFDQLFVKAVNRVVEKTS